MHLFTLPGAHSAFCKCARHRCARAERRSEADWICKPCCGEEGLVGGQEFTPGPLAEARRAPQAHGPRLRRGSSAPY